MSRNGTCKNCEYEYGLHMSETDRCPEDANGMRFGGSVWSAKNMIEEAASDLLAACKEEDRHALLRNALRENYCHLNDSGRTVSAESKMTARKNIEEIKAEIRAIEERRLAAIKKAEGR